jgi:hypothetical protein
MKIVLLYRSYIDIIGAVLTKQFKNTYKNYIDFKTIYLFPANSYTI